MMAQAAPPAQPPQMPQAQQLPLADIHLPDQISIWPPAYGWWILTLLVLTALFFIARAVKNWRAARIQKNIAIGELHAVDLNQATAWQQINEILKRAAMEYYSREQVASLTGLKWKAFLLQNLKKNAIAFDDNWLNFAYLPEIDAQQVKDYHQFAEQWLKQALPVKGGRHV